MDKPKKRIKARIGRNVRANNSLCRNVVEFGANTNVGDFTARDVAGGDILKIEHNYYCESKKEKSEIEVDEVFLRAIRALVMDDLWEAKRLLEKVLSVDPHFPRAREWLSNVDRHISVRELSAIAVLAITRKRSGFSSDT